MNALGQTGAQAVGATPPAGLPLNQDTRLWQWLLPYYVKWLEVCENQRWIAAGRGPKYPAALLPFIPFGVVPAVPFHNLLTTFIDTQICRRDKILPDPLGFKGHMATIIVDPPPLPNPYILTEQVFGGIVTDFEMRYDTDWETVSGELKKKGIDPDDYYKKIVATSFLRKVYELHQQWLIDGDNSGYLLGFLETLFKSMADGTAKIDPKPVLLQNLDAILRSVDLGDIDVWSVLRKYRRMIPDIVIEGRGGDIPIQLDARYSVVLTEQALIALLDGFKFCNTLADLTPFLIDFLEDALRDGWIKIGGLRWLSKISAFFLRRKIKALPKKIQILGKIMGNPFRLLVFSGDKALLVTLVEGLPASIRRVPGTFVGPDGETLPTKDIWLRVSRETGFVNLAVNLKTDGGGSLPSLEEMIDYYPRNDFVTYIMRKGALTIVFNLLLPFLSA